MERSHHVERRKGRSEERGHREVFFLDFWVIWRQILHVVILALVAASLWGGKEDTLLPDLRWPYFVSQSARVRGHKAVRFSPEMPCSIARFLYGAGSCVSNTAKECSLVVWCDGASQPGPRLSSKSIIMSVADSGQIEWNSHSIVPPLCMTGPFWVSIWEDESFPTIVVDAVASSPVCYSQDGVTWSPAVGDYFCGLVVRYVQPQLYVSPESLVLSISADSNVCDTVVLTVFNGSTTANLSVDSIVWPQPWVTSVTPSSFGLFPADSREVEVICGNVSSDGVHHDTLSIFSNDPENNPCLMPLVLTVSGYGVEENDYQLTMGKRQLTVHPNPFITKTVISYRLPVGAQGIVPVHAHSHSGPSTMDRGLPTIAIYDLTGRLVRSFPFDHSTIQPFSSEGGSPPEADEPLAHASGGNQITWDGKDDTGKEVGAGIYFVKIGRHVPVKVVKTVGLR